MTAPPIPFLTGYSEGFAQLLAGAEIGLSWQTYGAGNPGDWPVFLAAVPTSPDKIVTITPTPMDVHPTLNSARVNLQLRFRAGPDIRELWAMRDATRRVLAGLFPIRLSTGIKIATLTFNYGGSMGIDDAKRQMWADNYRTRASEPRN